MALWRLPSAASAALAGVLAGITPVVHDFWNLEDDQKQQAITHLLKNTALFGASMAFLRFGRRTD